MELNFAATVEVLSETHAARVQLTGDVDLAADDRLAEILSILSAAETRDVYVDLGGVTFAGASLMNFLVRAGAADGRNGPLVLCRVPPTVVRLIDILGLRAVALVLDERVPSHGV